MLFWVHARFGLRGLTGKPTLGRDSAIGEVAEWLKAAVC
jgi:hypothetical protein